MKQIKSHKFVMRYENIQTIRIHSKSLLIADGNLFWVKRIFNAVEILSSDAGPARRGK